MPRRRWLWSDPDIIRIQDRELAQLDPETNHRVRRLQRRYVAECDRVRVALRPGIEAGERGTRLLVTLGLVNSSPQSGAAAPAEAENVLSAIALRAPWLGPAETVDATR